MKNSATKNTTISTKNIKNFQVAAIQKKQLKALKGGTVIMDDIQW